MLQEKIQKAMKFAGEHHASQKVPGTNANYLLHISNVLMEVLVGYQNQPDFDVELAAQIAALHDVVEDSDVSVEILAKTFGEEVTEGVLALTKNGSLATKQDKMIDSLARINQQPREVGIVKLADRITNLQQPPASWDKAKKEYYLKEAQQIAEAMSGKHNYLVKRILQKIEDYRQYLG